MLPQVQKTCINRAIIGVLGILGAGCQTVVVNVPPPDTPRLQSVGFTGQRICGAPYSDSYGIIALNCDALPTLARTAWQLTPASLPGPLDPVPYVQNRTINLTLTAPTLNNLEIAYLPNATQRFVMQQVGPAERDTVIGLTGYGSRGRAGVVMTNDDGTTRTWNVRLRIHGCTDRALFEIASVATNGSARSNVLEVQVVRSQVDIDQICSGGTGGGGGGGGVTGSPSDPTSPPLPPPGPCPGGAPTTVFRVCQYQLTTPPPNPVNRYSDASACSFAEVQSAMGFMRNSPGALTPYELAGERLIQVPGPAACRGP